VFKKTTYVLLLLGGIFVVNHFPAIEAKDFSANGELSQEILSSPHIRTAKPLSGSPVDGK